MSDTTTSKRILTRTRLVAVAILVIIGLGAGTYIYLNVPSAPKQHLIISTTTSLYETGFLDVLKKEFENEYPSINVSFISQGTGLAIQTAMKGDADMILVHDAARELKFLQDGYGVNRRVLAYNFFVVVGPSDDPAKIKGLPPVDAFKKIKEAGEKKLALWASRGDDSGTHAKEKSIWKTAKLNSSELRKTDWYLEAGSGMTATLKLADEKRAYTITDLGSYLSNYNKKNIDLVVLVEAGRDTLNVYSAIANNPQKTEVAKSNFNASMTFIRFLVSDKCQDLFGSFGEKEYGQPLFAPYLKLAKSGSNPELMQWIQKLAYFNGTECPSQYRYKAEDLYANEPAYIVPSSTTEKPSTGSTELKVYAASTLAKAVKKHQAKFEKDNNAKLNITTGGSESLYKGISSGKSVDIYMTADFKWTKQLKSDKLLLNNEYKNFTVNSLIVIVATNNPNNITTLEELAQPHMRIAVANWTVSTGKATDTTLTKIQKTWGNRSDPKYKGVAWGNFRDRVLTNIVSYEPTVPRVIEKVLMGLSDAGFTYAIDAKPQGTNLSLIQIPSEVNTKIIYGIAVTKTSANPDLAKKYVDFWLSDDGQKLLSEYGFSPLK